MGVEFFVQGWSLATASSRWGAFVHLVHGSCRCPSPCSLQGGVGGLLHGACPSLLAEGTSPEGPEFGCCPGTGPKGFVMLMFLSFILHPHCRALLQTAPPPKLPLQSICLPGGQIYGRYPYKYLYSAARRFWRSHTHKHTHGPCATPSPDQATSCNQWLSDGHLCTHST